MNVGMQDFVGLSLFCWEYGNMCMVRCKVSCEVKGRDKRFVPKLDSLIKHLEMKKCILLLDLEWLLGSIFFDLLYANMKNEKLVVAKDIVAKQLVNGGNKARKNKYM
jgi:hypothetical protein